MSENLDQRIQSAIKEAAAAQDLIDMLNDDEDDGLEGDGFADDNYVRWSTIEMLDLTSSHGQCFSVLECLA